MTTMPSERATPAIIQFTPGEIDIIRTTIAPGLNDTELALYLHHAKRTGLDPLARQIHAFKNKQGRLSIFVAIDGYRLIADRTGEMDGTDGPYWADESGAWHDVWIDTSYPSAARITVFRRGHTHGYTAVARFASYNTGTYNWQRMPDVMIAKCAEALALRRAFPAELSGIYTQEEMEQAGVQTQPAVAQETAHSGAGAWIITRTKATQSGLTCKAKGCGRTIRKGSNIVEASRGSVTMVAHETCYDTQGAQEAKHESAEVDEEYEAAAVDRDESDESDDDLPY